MSTRYNNAFTSDEQLIMADVFGPILDAVDVTLPDWRERMLEGLHYAAGMLVSITVDKTIQRITKVPVTSIVMIEHAPAAWDNIKKMLAAAQEEYAKMNDGYMQFATELHVPTSYYPPEAATNEIPTT